MAQFIDMFRKNAPCLLRLEFGTPEHKPASWYIDAQGKAHTISFDTFSRLSISAHRAGVRPEIKNHEFFVSLLYPVKIGCDNCSYNFDGVCANHSTEDPDTYGTNISELQSKFPLGCSCLRVAPTWLRWLRPVRAYGVSRHGTGAPAA